MQNISPFELPWFKRDFFGGDLPRAGVLKQMHVLSLDCSGEFTGDSLIGALADLGVTPSTFEWELGRIELGDYHLHFDREEIAGARAVRFGVHGGMLHADHPTGHHPDHLQHAHDPAGYRDLRKKLETANFSESLKSPCLGILERIAVARSEPVGRKIDQMEFSEAEALESLVTIVLACVGLDQLQVAKIYFRQTQRTSGESAPQPTISQAILAKASISQSIEASPLGAAILVEFGITLDSPPKMKVLKTGYGLDPAAHSSGLLQATLGEAE
jgi:pyridinium-3,5-bisthiocarboxylic acid mononucleotide nickel chelatase